MRELLWPYRGVILDFDWKHWGKPRETLFRVLERPAEIRIRPLTNISPELYRCSKQLGEYRVSFFR